MSRGYARPLMLWTAPRSTGEAKATPCRVADQLHIHAVLLVVAGLERLIGGDRGEG